MKNKKFFKKGFTLLETIICLFLVSMLLVMTVSSMMKTGEISEETVTQITNRKTYNKIMWEISNGIDALLSTSDLSYSDFTTDGIIINNVLNEEEIKNADFSLPVSYETDDFTMYIKGDASRMDVKVEINAINDNIKHGKSCKVIVKDSILDEEAFENGNIEWKEHEEYTPLNTKTDFIKNGKEHKTKFIITVFDGKLIEIKSVFCLMKEKGNNEIVVNTYTCPQEVSVNAPTFEEENP